MILSCIEQLVKEGRKIFTVLVDPDKYDEDKLIDLAEYANRGKVDFFFVGGSLMTSSRFVQTIKILKSISKIPVVIFPGSNLQISRDADALLMLSLISGRNPEYLIGQHVVAAPYLRESKIEILPTGYMLIENERTTTANYMSNTLPIPADKSDIAACTAMAGEMLGLRLIYLDGGSGASSFILPQMVSAVKNAVSIPVIVGGGITNAAQALEVYNSGADMIVVGNAIESRLELIEEISLQLDSVK